MTRADANHVFDGSALRDPEVGLYNIIIHVGGSLREGSEGFNFLKKFSLWLKDWSENGDKKYRIRSMSIQERQPTEE